MKKHYLNSLYSVRQKTIKFLKRMFDNKYIYKTQGKKNFLFNTCSVRREKKSFQQTK